MYPLRSKDVFTVESNRHIALCVAFTEIERMLAPHAESVTQLGPNEVMFRAKLVSAYDGRNPLPTRGRVHLRANGNDIAVELLQDRYHLWFLPTAVAAAVLAVAWTWLAGLCALGAALALGAVSSSYDRSTVRQMVRDAISTAAVEPGSANNDG
jgi:hypothetical protein